MPNARVLLFFVVVSFVAALFFVYVVPLIRRYLKDAKKVYEQEEDALGVGDEKVKNKQGEKP